MKVLYITHSVGMGGASVALVNILEYSAKNGITPMVTCPATGTFSAQLEKMDIPFVAIGNPLEIYPRVSSWKSCVKYPYLLLGMVLKRHIAYKKLCSCIERFKPDIIHTNVGPIHIGYLAAKRYGIPHVWHIREYQKEDFGMHPFPSMNVYLKRIHEKDNHCISITRNIFVHFKLESLKDKVIYDGVIDRKDVKAVNKNKKLYILFVGRLEDAKGLKELLYAYNKYALNAGKFDLYIAGSGNAGYKNECLDILAESVKSRVLFLGECEHSRIFGLMYGAAVMVVPSRNEGFGFITAEAMFNGTVVIGKDTGGTKEQMDNGKDLTGEEIAFRYMEPQDLADLLFKVQTLDCSIYADMASKAQGVVCKLYDKEQQCKKISQFYMQVKKQ